MFLRIMRAPTSALLQCTKRPQRIAAANADFRLRHLCAAHRLDYMLFGRGFSFEYGTLQLSDLLGLYFSAFPDLLPARQLAEKTHLRNLLVSIIAERPYTCRRQHNIRAALSV